MSCSSLRVRRTLGVFALGCALMAACGCYERVVGAKGFGADKAQIQQANNPDGSKNSNLMTRRTTVKEIQNPK